ncbi:short-chain dehydrogenase [Leifsonia xyli]|uniref:SDR family NAD(P)-dependent oxidoreductase n=1 Tax=Leifsonia xyli TaxID=1575 RepID=UPI0007CE00DE|nr:short-chain dehydrogenase [Leifsonia xyli]
MMILVTGASTGLGLSTADSLARTGHRVVLHARRPDRLTDPEVADRMHALVFGDLADASAVLDVARQANDLGRFDAVIHNAGVIDGPVTAVNVVAPYLLMASLTPPDRSIVLSSGMHRSGSPDLDRAFAGRGDYSTSKLLVTALAMWLADNSDTLSHAVDPGWVPTRMGGRGAPDSLEEGHRTQEWLATADAASIDPITGGYWYHRQARAPHPAATDPAFQARLVERLADVTGVELGR